MMSAANFRWRDSFEAGILSTLAASVIIFTVSDLRSSYGRELYPGQYAQVDPGIRQWFRDQKSPRTGIPCCNEADGAYAEEEIRDGHYRARFTWRSCFARECHDIDSGWMDVPDDVVIHDPNRRGAPVVWWYRGSSRDPENPTVGIRCYAPGSGV
jgi:hypothetical protein